LQNGGVALAPAHTLSSRIPVVLRTELPRVQQEIVKGSISIDASDYLGM
jgi:hypothetical protein